MISIPHWVTMTTPGKPGLLEVPGSDHKAQKCIWATVLLPFDVFLLKDDAASTGKQKLGQFSATNWIHSERKSLFACAEWHKIII